MELQFLGAAGTVTGSKTLIENDGYRILVDCGLFQGAKKWREQNWEHFPVPIRTLDAVVLTHAHIDHTGYLPILVRDGFKGPIYATSATRDLCEILLRDSGRIHEEDAKRANRLGYSKHIPALPLYTEEDALRCMPLFKTIPWGTEIPLGKDLVVHASRAGHILGAAILTFRNGNVTLVMSGDLGRPKDPIIKSPATIQIADALVLESTYGNRPHTEEDSTERLRDIICKTAKRGGVVIIPAFAVGRAQKILYMLDQLKKKNTIPDIPIVLDSPMAQDATEILRKNKDEHLLSQELCHEVCSVARYIQSPEESKALHGQHYPMVILTASGMAEGGRILHHLKRYAPHHQNSIVFVGFQAPMTRGDIILKGAREVKIHGEMVPIRAKVECLEGLSSHADANEILDWLKKFVRAPKQVFLNHGEPDALLALKERIEKELNWRVIIPAQLDTYEL